MIIDLNKAITFIKHGVLARQFDESLTHIHFTHNNIQSYNGVVAMSYPIDQPHVFSVDSTRLIKAIQACNFAPDLKISEKNVIARGNNFRSILPRLPESLAIKKEKGEKYILPPDLIEKLSKLFPLISDDASRAWSQTILIKKGYAYVTNNIIIARVKLDMPNCILPIELIGVMLKAKESPEYILLGNRNMVVMYPDKKWIQCTRASHKWPDKIDHFFTKSKPPKVPEGFKDAVETIYPFVDDDDILTVEGGKMSTGTTVIKDIKVPDCSISCSNIRKVLLSFDRVDFTSKVMSLKGKGITGVMSQVVKI